MVRFESVELTKRLYGEEEVGVTEEEEIIGEKEEEEEAIDDGVGNPAHLENKGDGVIRNQSEINIYDPSDINNALSVVLVDSNIPYEGNLYLSCSFLDFVKCADLDIKISVWARFSLPS